MSNDGKIAVVLEAHESEGLGVICRKADADKKMHWIRVVTSLNGKGAFPS